MSLIVPAEGRVPQSHWLIVLEILLPFLNTLWGQWGKFWNMRLNTNICIRECRETERPVHSGDKKKKSGHKNGTVWSSACA